ncbi:MAG: ACT domain-containing protein [Christensenellaceae bacterium]|jgi:ACT domain-containing protein|nr:ACT domain-containing protein [Christensenellaceae bacterium]
MKAFITVIGADRIGIIAAVSGLLAAEKINIEDISQTILQGNFTMIMAVSFSEDAKPIDEIAHLLREKGDEMGLDISIRHMAIFEAMHRI